MKLIVATDSARVPAAARTALTAFLEGKGWSVWHWFSDLWLIGDAPETTDVHKLRADITATIPTLGIILIFGPNQKVGGMVPSESIAVQDVNDSRNRLLWIKGRRGPSESDEESGWGAACCSGIAAVQDVES